MDMEENDDDGARDGETAGEADAPAAASTTAPALPIAAAAAPPANVTEIVDAFEIRTHTHRYCGYATEAHVRALR